MFPHPWDVPFLTFVRSHDCEEGQVQDGRGQNGRWQVDR